MKWLSLLLTYLPAVLQAVTAVEASIKDAPGASKKQLVMDVITNAAAVGEKIPDAHVQQISNLIDVVVGSLNNSGVFKSPTKKLAADVTVVK